MSLKEDVLRELIKTDEYISGEVLARKFGKSRAAVWKAIKTLIADGCSIVAVTNKGYRLLEGGRPASSCEIKAFLENDFDVVHYKSIDSTNNACKRLLADGKAGEFLVFADEQSAGRGRQGKSFYSPKLDGVYFSVVLKPYAKLQNAVTATTAASVAVCKAIEKLTDKKPQIKWVNDVYLGGKKICGILTEAITDFEQGIVESVIVGIGININENECDIENIGFLGCDIDKNRLIAEVTNELVKTACSDYENFIDYYISHSLIIGKDIKFIQNGKATQAKAIAIDKTGGLEIELENGEHQTLRSGDISIRKA